MNPLKRGKRVVTSKLNARTRRIIESTVKQAAKRLDREFPGWARHVKLSELEFDSSCHCVYGQLGTASCEVTRGPLAKKLDPLTFLCDEYAGDRTFNRLADKGWDKGDIIGYCVPDAAYNAAGIEACGNDAPKAVQKYEDLWAYQENAWRDEIRQRARYDLPVAA